MTETEHLLAIEALDGSDVGQQIRLRPYVVVTREDVTRQNSTNERSNTRLEALGFKVALSAA